MIIAIMPPGQEEELIEGFAQLPGLMYLFLAVLLQIMT